MTKHTAFMKMQKAVYQREVWQGNSPRRENNQTEDPTEKENYD